MAEVEMTKKVEVSAEERAQLVLRFLSREDLAANPQQQFL